jgi:hypothetical protein
VPQGVAEEVDGAALPGRTQHLGDGLLEALVGVGDDQLHPSEATADQAAQELAPERLGLGRAHIQADHLPLAAGVHPVGDHQGVVLDPPAGADLLDLGVQPQIWVVAVQRSLAKGRDLLVQASTQPRDGVFGHPGQPQGLHQPVHLAGRHPVDIRLLTTATSACSLRRRGSRKLGNYEPERSLGMASSIDPTLVSQGRWR